MKRASIDIPLNKFIRFRMLARESFPDESKCKSSYLENYEKTGLSFKVLIKMELSILLKP
jgi:hypothetical protein